MRIYVLRATWSPDLVTIKSHESTRPGHLYCYHQSHLKILTDYEVTRGLEISIMRQIQKNMTSYDSISSQHCHLPRNPTICTYCPTLPPTSPPNLFLVGTREWGWWAAKGGGRLTVAVGTQNGLHSPPLTAHPTQCPTPLSTPPIKANTHSTKPHQ